MDFQQFQQPFNENTILSLLNCFYIFVKNDLNILLSFKCLLFHQYYFLDYCSFITSLEQQYNFSNFVLIFSILYYSKLFAVPYNFQIILLISIKQDSRDFEIAVIVQIKVGRINILIILSLPIHEHEFMIALVNISQFLKYILPKFGYIYI